MSQLADYALELLGSSEPDRDQRLDQLLIDLADELVHSDDSFTDFDDMTLCALVDGMLPEDEAAEAMASVRTNPRRLEAYIKLKTTLEVIDPEPEAPGGDVIPIRPPKAPPVPESAAPPRWLRLVGSIAAVLLIGVVFQMMPPGLPGPVDAQLVTGRTVRSNSVTVGDTLALSATVTDDAWWAVVTASGPLDGRPLRVWVAQTWTRGSAEGRVSYSETVSLPVGRRAYFVLAGTSPLESLPELVASWETELGTTSSADAFLRDLEARVDAAAHEKKWAVGEALQVTVTDDDL